MRGVSRAHSNSLEPDVELLGGDLRQRGKVSLPELHFSSEYFDCSVRIDPQPRIETFIGFQIRGKPFGGDLSESAAGIHREEQHESRSHLAKLAA
jgi:hypothetical protein